LLRVVRSQISPTTLDGPVASPDLPSVAASSAMSRGHRTGG
jgi:hypothetical protein